MTTVTRDSIADPASTPATAPQTHGRLQSASGRCFAATPNRDTEQALRHAGFALETIRHGPMEAELVLRPLPWGTAKVAPA